MNKKKILKLFNDAFKDNHPEKQIRCKHCKRLYASYQLKSIYDSNCNGYKCIECGGYFA